MFEAMLKWEYEGWVLIPVDCWESQGMPLVLRLLAMACINVSGWLRMFLLHSLRFDGTKWNFEGFQYLWE